MSKGYRVCDGVEIFPGGAALLTDENVLVVADMHLGCESVLEQQGLSIPRVQTRKIEQYMRKTIGALAPSKIIVAGDLKHNFSKNLIQEWHDIRRFVELLSESVRLEVVKGNHDNYLGLILREHHVPLTHELRCGRIRIIHGHSGVLTDGMTIMGHIHPAMRLKDSVGASLKDQCFLYDDKRGILVLPALSLVSPGNDVVGSESSDSVSPLLADKGLSDFVPIAFSGEKALEFPSIRKLRAIRRTN